MWGDRGNGERKRCKRKGRDKKSELEDHNKDTLSFLHNAAVGRSFARVHISNT